MLESLTDFLIAIGVLWLLCLAMPLFNEIRRQSPIDDDIAQDWADLRQAIRITNRRLTRRLRRHR